MCLSAIGDEFNELFVEQLLMADSSERYPSRCFESLQDSDARENGELSLIGEILMSIECLNMDIWVFVFCDWIFIILIILGLNLYTKFFNKVT